MNNIITKEDLKNQIMDFLWEKYGCEFYDSTKIQLYTAISSVVKSILSKKYHTFVNEANKQNAKRVCYLSMEFLVGKNLRNNIYNLGILDFIEELIADCDYEPDEIYSQEKDPALGNGGLGRLAASYMDALASGDYRGEGYSILYEYGIFRQYIKDGEQMELPDVWLNSGEAWLNKADDDRITVKIGGTLSYRENKEVYANYSEIIAQGYDIFISGYKSQGVSKLRLWKATANHKFDMHLLDEGKFDTIINKKGEAELVSMFLYPSDSTEAGKKLRLVQQYFFVSATLQKVLSEHFKKFRTIDNLSEYISFHINDTHPAVCIPELIRILTEDYSVEYDKALSITKRCVSYTNHTVMPEALECWEEDLISKILPKIYNILVRINKEQLSEIYKYSSTHWDKINEVSIISDNKIKMANLSVFSAHKVNGVSSLHSEIIKNELFADFSKITPEKFINVTNGISYRRWLCQANRSLTKVIDDTIGTGYKDRPHELIKLKEYANDKTFLDSFKNTRYENKIKLSEISKKLTGVALDPDSMFDVQIKRLHEYKRQLLNILKIISYYLEIKNNVSADISPKTFIFAAKAAPSYHHAKRIIMLINKLSETIQKDERAKDKIKVVFLPDYNVWLAENIIPAADLSEQISLAGKEASGTGNMKLMLNGALTIGTYDGANVEISDIVGNDNAYIFGLRVEDVNGITKHKSQVIEAIKENERLSEVIEFLRSDISGEDFSDIADYLTTGQYPDPYLCTLDYSSYLKTYRSACIDYNESKKFYSKALINIAFSGYFASDRAIEEYSQKIWNLQKVKM